MSGQFIFWKYDRFPYVLGSEVAEQNPETLKYRTKGYGGQFVFDPNKVHVMPLQAGQDTLKQLEALEAEYDTAKEALHEEFMKKRSKIAPFLDTPLWKAR